MQELHRHSQVVPCGMAGTLTGVLQSFRLSASGGVGAGCSLWTLLFLFWEGDLWVIFSEFAGGLWGLCITDRVLVVLFGACRGTWVSASTVGLWLLWPFLDLLLEGFGKIRMSQIIRFAIYLRKVSNADVMKYNFQTNVVVFVGLLSSANMYSRNLFILLMLFCSAKSNLGLSL